MSQYPLRISLDILDIMNSFHADIRSMTDHDYDVGEILGNMFKIIEYDIFFQERKDIFFDRWYYNKSHLSRSDTTILGHGMLKLCQDLFALFDLPSLRDSQGCLLYRVEDVINDSTLIMTLRQQFVNSNQSMLQLDSIAKSN